jgi:hypothetical protein
MGAKFDFFDKNQLQKALLQAENLQLRAPLLYKLIE